MQTNEHADERQAIVCNKCNQSSLLIAMTNEMPISTTTTSTNSPKSEQSQCQSTQKYGDADVCSKRRKANGRAAEDEVDYLQFVEEANLNSSFNAGIEQIKQIPTELNLSKRDFEQEVCRAIERKIVAKRLSTIGTLDIIAETNNEPDNETLLISPKPACSSKGFENTFSLLQQQLQKSSDKSQTLKQSFSNESAVSGIPEDNSAMSRFELELQARARLHTLGEQVDAAMATEYQHLSFKEQERLVARTPAPPLLSLLYDFAVGKSTAAHALDGYDQNVLELRKQQRMKAMCGVHREQLIYHASVGADGDKYLRVMRNARSLHDRGRHTLSRLLN